MNGDVTIASLREQLVDSIYALVDNENEWPNTLHSLDALLAQSDDENPLSGYDTDIMSLLPHVNRVNLLLERIDRLQLKTTHADKLLDHIPMGIMILSSDREIISRNSRALELLDHVQARREGARLQFADRQHDKAFKRAVTEVTNGNTRGTSVVMGHLNLWVSPYGHQKSGQLSVFLGHRTFRRNIQIPSLIKHYDLTRKEAQLTSELCNGFTNLEDTARSMGISIATARSHLKKVFAKTDTKRQADLVKMVLVNPALALQREPETIIKPDAEKLQLARLPSGRTLSWAEYGDPTGQPVLLCHAITGCRLMIPPDHATLEKQHIRLIVPDRAGFGLSAPATGNPMHQWLEDMRHFIPQVGASGCCVIGHSGGGACAIALAAECPGLVGRLCLISSIAPLLDAEDVRRLLPVNRMLIRLARSTKGAAKSFLKLAFQAAAKRPAGYFDLILNSVPDLDKEVFGNPRLRTLLLEGFAETTRQGIDHLIDEMLYIATDWRVDTGSIQCPVSIWHGKEDRHAPFPLMQRFSREFNQTPETHWVDGAGHYMLFYRWSDILEAISRQISRATAPPKR